MYVCMFLNRLICLHMIQHRGTTQGYDAKVRPKGTTKRYDTTLRIKPTDQTYGLTYKVIYIILIPPVSPVPMAKPAP